MRLQVLAADDGTVLADALDVAALPTHVLLHTATGAEYEARITASLAPISTAAGAVVRVWCEPGTPGGPPPPPPS